MPTYDLIDETIIDATPSEIVAALEDEATGRSRWWRPWLVMKVEGPRAAFTVGTPLSIRISEVGQPDRRLTSLRMRAVVTQVEPNRAITYRLTGGPFRGTGEWRFDRLEARRTRVSLRWRMQPTGLMRLWSRFLDVPARHSRVMRKGFEGLASFVAERQARAPH